MFKLSIDKKALKEITNIDRRIYWRFIDAMRFDLINQYKSILKDSIRKSGVQNPEWVANRFDFDIKVDKRTISVDMSEDGTPIGFKLNYGGFIKPRQRKFLTVPVKGSRYRSGQYKKFAAENEGNISLKPFVSKSGLGYVAGIGKGQVFDPQYLLLQSVRLRPRHFIEKSLRDFRPIFVSELVNALKKEFGQ